MSYLIAIGTSVCGATAIVATAPVLNAKKTEIAYAIANITLFGVIAMIIYPYFAEWYFEGEPLKSGLFLGTSIIFLIENIFSNITKPTKQVISIIILSITILFCISLFCRLSLIIPMAASNRKIDLREALIQSKEIGIKMATIWLLCLMLVIALSIPIQIIFLLISKGLNFLSFGIIDSNYIFQNLFVPIMNSTISLLLLLFPATMVGFIYNNISSIVKDGDYDE